MRQTGSVRRADGEIDMQVLLQAVLHKLWLVALAAMIGAVLFFLVTALFITPMYQSSAMFYVNNTNLPVGTITMGISSGDLAASIQLVDSYMVILESRETLLDVAEYAGVERSVEALRSMIETASVESTEVFEVIVTGPDPQEAERIASAVAYILPNRISGIIEGTSAKIVDSAVVPVSPVSPDRWKNTTIGFVLGAAVAIGLIVLFQLLDERIRSEEDITRCCGSPVLASIPDAGASSGSSYSKDTDRPSQRNAEPVAGGVSFAMDEAYKLLRTKLLYSFAGTESCRVIGLTSALPGEGKSLTAVNLAYSLSQTGQRVLVIGCDLRRPGLHEKLPIQTAPGLSEVLSGQKSLDQTMQYCGLPEDQAAFHVLAAGTLPPNPAELLGSERMEKLLEFLRGHYDYILLDLPPVGTVSDALTVAELADGFVLVVRQGLCDRQSLTSAAKQLSFVNAKVLGVVHNGVSAQSRYYAKKGEYYAEKAPRPVGGD